MRFRRLLVWFLCMGMLVCPALAEVCAVNYLGGAVAVDGTGAVLVPAGKYDEIFAMYDDAGAHTGYAAGKLTETGMLYAVLDSAGNELTDFIYSGVWQAGNGCIVLENGLYRYLNSAHMYDDMGFSDMVYAGEGIVLAVNGNIYDDIGDAITVLWADGIYFRTSIRILNGFSSFSEGLMPVYDAATRLYGYINNQASWVISPSYRYADAFTDGLAVVAGEDGYGVIDATGKIMLSPSSLRFTRTDSMFAMIRSGALRVYDSQLRPCFVLPLEDRSASISGDYIILSSVEDTTVIDMRGNELFSVASVARITNVAEGLFAVREGSWQNSSAGLYTSEGVPVSDGYVSLYALDDSAIAYSVYSDDGNILYGLMDRYGKPLTDALYTAVASAGGGMYIADGSTGAVLLDGSGGIMNTFKVNRRDEASPAQ